jgi:hypothetical protein
VGGGGGRDIERFKICISAVESSNYKKCSIKFTFVAKKLFGFGFPDVPNNTMYLTIGGTHLIYSIKSSWH